MGGMYRRRPSENILSKIQRFSRRWTLWPKIFIVASLLTCLFLLSRHFNFKSTDSILTTNLYPSAGQTPREICRCSWYRRSKYAKTRKNTRNILKCAPNFLTNGTTENCRNEAEMKSLAPSSCSDEATMAGRNQMVISYSLYPGHDWSVESYLKGLSKIIGQIKRFYPGSLIRIYSNISLTDSNYSYKFCPLICTYRQLYFCPVENIRQFGNLSEISPMFYRFLPLGDLTVRQFLVRDIDAEIRPREVAAVRQWENSIYSFHNMRDHPSHCDQTRPIVAGSFAGNNKKIGYLNASRTLRRLLKYGHGTDYGVDQLALAARVYANNERNFLSHDSYCCLLFSDTAPFPTRRIISTPYVVDHSRNQFMQRNRSLAMGQKRAAKLLGLKPPVKIIAVCPEMCRPLHGKNWEIC